MTRKLQNKLLFDPPDVIDKSCSTLRRSEFEFIRKIGDGSYGQVWKVRHKQLNKFWALKQVPKVKVLKILPQFRRELIILYELSHPHIIKLLSHFEDDKNFYLVMELLEGGSLFHKLYREKNLLESTAAQYFREIILAIEYLHTRNPPIAHRDIKPENIMISKDGRIKLIDFGWATYFDKDIESRNTMCGTIEYLAPEMIGNKGHTISVDIWCLGILLFEMLAGYTPFSAPEKEKTTKGILEGRVKYPLAIPPLAKDLIGAMLEKDVNKRLNVFQVKEHRWLLDVLPIRETHVQNFRDADIPYTKKHAFDEKKEQATASSINSDSDDDNETFKFQHRFTKSKDFIKDAVIFKYNENIIEKSKIERSEKELSEKKNLLSELEERVNAKKKEISRATCSIKELLSMTFDANLELERLQGDDINEISEKNNNLQAKVLEISKNCKLHKLNLENLRKKVNKESITSLNSEIHLKKLQNSLKSFQEMAKNVNCHKNSSEKELKISIDLLKQQLKEKSSVFSNFTCEELKEAKEISVVIKSNMHSFNSLMRDIKKRIEKTDEKINEIEQQMQELKIHHEMKKCSIFQSLRNAKDEHNQNKRKNKDEKLFLFRKFNDKNREELRLRLNAARKINFPIDDTDILRANSRITVNYIQTLKNMIFRLEKIEKRKRNDHEMMKIEIQNKQKMIDDLIYNCNLKI